MNTNIFKCRKISPVSNFVISDKEEKVKLEMQIFVKEWHVTGITNSNYMSVLTLQANGLDLAMCAYLLSFTL